mgnify:CR=1 FL=1
MSQSVCILIVDDNRSMVKTLQDISAVMNCWSVGVTSGAEALEKLAQQRFDCVLSDVSMAGISGVALQRAIHERWPETLVILMAAYMTEMLVQKQLAAGALAVLEKPLDVQLLATFFSYLRRKQAIAVISHDNNVTSTLRRHGYDVTQATPSTTIQQALIQKVSLIILDLDVHSGDDLSTLQHLATHFPSQPLLLITTHHRKAATRIIKIREAYGWLPKPFQMQDLIALISKLQRKRMQRLLEQPSPSRKRGDS